MKTQTRISALIKHAPGVHFTTVSFDNGAAEYCNKEETRQEGPWTAGIRPARVNKSGDKKRRNKELITKGAEQAVLDGDIRIEDYPKVKGAIDLYLNCTTKPDDLTELDNQWHHGRPGAGKTRHCINTYPGYYEKDKSKYWNGYTNQQVVLVDDIEEDDKFMLNNLKKWCQHKSF